MTKAWTAVTVGVSSLETALDLWTNDLGFNVVSESSGADPELARLAGLSPDAICAQAVVGTGTAGYGMIHLLEFSDPLPPVRLGAAAFDLCPKNLDIYAHDIPSRIAALRAAGREFRNDEYSEITTPSGLTFREIHMPSHDCVNVVLLELLDVELPFSPQGFAGVGPLITIVGDAGREARFYRDVIGLECLSRTRLDGPEIERMIGLPEGAALDVSIWGDSGQPLGQVEIIEYQGVQGRNLYPQARPPATGILELTYVVNESGPVRERLNAGGYSVTERGIADTLIAKGRILEARTPAGFRIRFCESP